MEMTMMVVRPYVTDLISQSGIKIEALRGQRPKGIYPVALPVFLPVKVGRVHHFDDHNCKVIKPTQMFCHGFIRSFRW